MRSKGDNLAAPRDPLQAILEMLQGGGIHSLYDIATRLGISLELARAMTSQLVSGGYLATLCGEAQNACRSCGSKAGCTTGAGGRVGEALMLTEKGRRATDRRRSA
jgi:hypothetical protein